jgi:hypothetical protein
VGVCIPVVEGTAEQKPATSLTFLLNFFDELRGVYR